MESYGVTDLNQQEHNRWADQVNKESWKFEHIEQPARGRMKLANLRKRFGR